MHNCIYSCELFVHSVLIENRRNHMISIILVNRQNILFELFDICVIEIDYRHVYSLPYFFLVSNEEKRS